MLNFQKLTKILEAVGVRVTPLSQESNKDLEILEGEEAETLNGAEIENSTTNPPIDGTLDESSMVIERLKELSNKCEDAKQERISEDEEEEDYLTLAFRKQPPEDPLGVNKAKQLPRRGSTETFHSAISALDINKN
jgi:hypothetical protein